MMTITDKSRYKNKPLLRLLECYVLWTINELSASDMSTLDSVTPKLQAVYKKNGDWQHIVSSIMELPVNMPDLIRSKWVALRSDTNATMLTPQRFAEVFVDQNFVK